MKNKTILKAVKICLCALIILTACIIPTFAEDPELFAYNGVIPQGKYIFNGIGANPVELQIGVDENADLVYGNWFTVDGESCFLIDFMPSDDTYSYFYLPEWDTIDALVVDSPLDVLFDVEVTKEQYNAFMYYFMPEGGYPDPDPDPEPVPTINIYQTCYDLVNTYVFGGTVVANTYQDLICIAFSAAACIFLMCLPFLLVWIILKVWF